MPLPGRGHDRFIEELTSFIARDLLRDAGARIDAEVYLFDTGLIDSLKILRLLAFVENWTGREIPDAEVVMSNFRSIRAIAERFVNQDSATIQSKTSPTR
jgi:2-hydroxymuconate-semialdehyde hydrolase